MIWLGERRGYLTDWITQRWVQMTGRQVARSTAPWLARPVGESRGIGPAFFTDLAAARQLTVGIVLMRPIAHADGSLSVVSAGNLWGMTFLRLHYRLRPRARLGDGTLAPTSAQR